ncbi:vicilin Jug r 2.0101 [Mercurialis annua]|uniref:vicilin Jug r 2.0101 n=1 Tax=Mercurialis annua TaxID=3986 RepID=UPI00215F48A2|nr:vicilin Jug r 2.0101 [Mercurialis annua]
MSIKNFVFLLILLFLSHSSLGYERRYGDFTERGPGEDPKSPWKEIQRCQKSCEREETDRRGLQICRQRCEEEAVKRRSEEQEQGQEKQAREKLEKEKRDDPRRQYERCRQLCDQKQEQRQKQQCQSSCERKYKEQKEEWEREHGRRGNSETETKTREIERQQRDNPYYFHSQRLQSRFRTEEGHIRVLEQFTKSSELLRGIENYRLSLMEASPNTFVVPHHCDAESLVVVLNGKGTISYVLRDKRETYNLETGDVVKIPAGATVYMINHDNNEKLSLAKLFVPVNVPGRFMEYFAAGGENPESFYTVFSNDVLEAALDTPRDELNKLFGQQTQGVILKASQKQLKALTGRVSSSSSSRQKSQGPFNLLNQRPLYSNRYGNLMEASPNDYKQLQDIDVSVSFAEINKGSLMVPHYNSRATMIVLVVEGSGRMEMACPHLASQRQEQEQEQDRTTARKQYQKISSDLSTGDVFIVPAGHPIAILASQNENLQTLAFGINAWSNERNFLAGQKDNIMKQIEREANELSFNAPAELIEKIFRNQKESHFVPQQSQRQQRGEERTFPSILEFDGFF